VLECGNRHGHFPHPVGISELVSGQQITSGNLARLTTVKWLNRWKAR
jgi:hypothetical protein